MEVEYVTHASLRVGAGGRSLLTDPFYFFDDLARRVMCHFPPREFREEDFGFCDFVYSSHIHPDHSHPETLLRLRDRIGKVLLPAERPALVERYRDLGFEDIAILENGERVELCPELAVTSFWDSPVDTVLVIESEGRAVLHQNDCRLKIRTVASIASSHAIDYAFLNYTWVQDLYPLLLPRPEEELTRLMGEKERDCLAYQLACIDVLRPGTVIPYSMTMTYFQPDQIHLNGHGRTIPPVFLERLAERRPQQASLLLSPGDVLDGETGAVRRCSGGNAWGKNLDEYLGHVAAFAKGNPALPRFEYGRPSAVEPELLAHFARRCREPLVPHLRGRRVRIEVVGDDERRSYDVDLRTGRVSRDERENGAFLTLSIPASTLESVLDRSYDPFSALFSYRIRFRLGVPSELPPQDETWLYILCMISLFRPDLQDEALKERAV